MNRLTGTIVVVILHVEQMQWFFLNLQNRRELMNNED